MLWGTPEAESMKQTEQNRLYSLAILVFVGAALLSIGTKVWQSSDPPAAVKSSSARGRVRPKDLASLRRHFSSKHFSSKEAWFYRKPSRARPGEAGRQ